MMRQNGLAMCLQLVESSPRPALQDLLAPTRARFHYACPCKFECEWGRVDAGGRGDTAPLCFIMTYTPAQ
ncbi:hypothetical protein Y032_0157g3174 [Ancylostoma ceylanicum]|uniref:Uncharacterized protein n=1 Tax=Ancylostoma ceylanicum TaxID=53326 RepID=A0A016SYW3_9BILA|nr:hypothetical protein Y032_0157g3174 [Ancylostoma ceylanicum]